MDLGSIPLQDDLNLRTSIGTDPISKQVPILRSWELGLQHIILGEHNSIQNGGRGRGATTFQAEGMARAKGLGQERALVWGPGFLQTLVCCCFPCKPYS